MPSTLWLSDDAVSWEQVHEFDQTEFFVQLDDADGGEEGYVVLGRRLDANGGYVRFAFASADGREWVNADQPFGPDDQAFAPSMSVTSFGADWIATLGQPNGEPTLVRFSADGLEWSEHGTLAQESYTTAGILEDTALGLLYTIRGSGAPFDVVTAAWLSSDGASWTETPLAEGASVSDAAEGDGILALIGSVTSPEAFGTPAIWVQSTE